MTELIGDDKDQAMRVIDDDEKFDSWLARYSAKQKQKPGAKAKTVSKEEFFHRTKGTLPQPGQKRGKKEGKH